MSTISRVHVNGPSSFIEQVNFVDEEEEGKTYKGYGSGVWDRTAHDGLPSLSAHGNRRARDERRQCEGDGRTEENEHCREKRYRLLGA